MKTNERTTWNATAQNDILEAMIQVKPRLSRMWAIADLRQACPKLSRTEFRLALNSLVSDDVLTLEKAESNKILATAQDRDGEYGCHWASFRQ